MQYRTPFTNTTLRGRPCDEPEQLSAITSTQPPLPKKAPRGTATVPRGATHTHASTHTSRLSSSRWTALMPWHRRVLLLLLLLLLRVPHAARTGLVGTCNRLEVT